MAQYDYNVFKACNNKYKTYGCVKTTIVSVNNKAGICKLNWTVYGQLKEEDISIETLVKRYITSNFTLPYITNPSAIKTWKGFHTFRFDESIKKDIEYMLLGVREQYTDIVQGIGAVKHGLTYNLKLNDNVVEFSGMMASDIPFKKKTFKIEGKSIESLENEIKSYLFDTLDGIVNVY